MNITHLKQSHFNFTIAPNLFVMQKKCIVPGLPNAPLQLTITMITQPWNQNGAVLVLFAVVKLI